MGRLTELYNRLPAGHPYNMQHTTCLDHWFLDFFITQYSKWNSKFLSQNVKVREHLFNWLYQMT